MLSGSEASEEAMLTAQHDIPLMLFHGMTCLERSVLAGLIENLIEDDAGGD